MMKTALERILHYTNRCLSRLRRKSIKAVSSIYPISIPDISFQMDQDMILLELPPRYLPIIPNGIGYVHNILKSTGIRFQTMDLNIIMYHRFHSRRIAEGLTAEKGDIPMDDPWDNINCDAWSSDTVLNFFRNDIEEIIAGLIAARPRIVGFSLNGFNRVLAGRITARLREALPGIIIMVGGYDCMYPNVGPKMFNNFDYMFIGEAELTLPPLLDLLIKGGQPGNLPGIISKFDTPDRVWQHAPLPVNLDMFGFPRYDWTNLDLYRYHNGYLLVPVAASRGCHWARCTFCAECFIWRQRKPELVVDEIEWLTTRGCDLLHFNESDLNGDHATLLAICDEIIRRGLSVRLVGQLRVDKKNTRQFFQKLARAGFCSLRFGVDGWSRNTLRLQNKGYTMDMVHQNLRDCYLAGIPIDVNIVLGVPGETDQDVSEMIENLLMNRHYIQSIAGLNTLILAAGSRYYQDPDNFGIRFRSDRDRIYAEHPTAIPYELWYSENPYIDQPIRIQRMKRIITSLHEHGFNVGQYAQYIINKRHGVKVAGQADDRLQQVMITASSILNEQDMNMGPTGLLAGSGTWHAQIPPAFPEWVQLEYTTPVQFTRLMLKPQESSPGGNEYQRAPKDFVLQALSPDRNWIDLLAVEGNLHEDSSDWHEWKFANDHKYGCYRLHIRSAGLPGLLTIHRIVLE